MQPAKPTPVTAVSIPEPAGGVWGSWRGGDLHGWAPDSHPPLKWSNDQSVLWRTELHGTGNSSPVVWGGRIFITAEQETSSADKHPALLVQCYDRSTGEQLWQRNAGQATGRTHLKNGYASATVACDGQHVIAYFAGLGLTAYSMEGEKLWDCPLQPGDLQWGGASSPVLAGNLVLQLCDGPKDSFLAGVNRHNGAIVWKTPRKSEGSWTSPIVVQAPLVTKTRTKGSVRIKSAPADSTAEVKTKSAKQHKRYRSEVIVNGSGAAPGSHGWVNAYDPLTGKQLWRVRGVSDIACPTAIAGNGMVVSTSGGNGPMIAIRTGGKGDVTRSHVDWRMSKGGAYVPTGVIVNQLLFTVDDNGLVSCRDLLDGTLHWSRKLRHKFTASLVAADDRIYATSESGTTFVFKASPRKFELLAANRLHAQCYATPAIAGNDLVIRTDTQLYMIRRPEAEIVAASNPVEASPSDTPVQGSSTISIASPGGVLAPGGSAIEESSAAMAQP